MLHAAKLKNYKTIFSNISLVIPVAKWETSWHFLLRDMRLFPCTMEVILVSPSTPSAYDKRLMDRFKNYHNIRWILSKPGRAQQLNVGAEIATRKFLWFLHADSHFNGKSVLALAKSIQKKERALHYFRLAFLPDGPRFLMSLTAFGVYLRSTFLKLPWGDQGFCLTKKLFFELGKYPEDVPYGEDHVFVWQTRKHIPIQQVRATLYTSARKYAENGWFTTTWLHFWQAIAQIYVEGLKSTRLFGKTKLKESAEPTKRRATPIEVFPVRAKINTKPPEKTL